MRIKKIKIWQMLLMFIIWIGVMFLPATVNQNKLNTNFDYKKVEKISFIFFFISSLFIVLFWVCCYFSHFFSFIIKKQSLVSIFLLLV